MMIDSFYMNIEDSDICGNVQQDRDYIIHVHYSDSDHLAMGMVTLIL
jgi:sugar phosphate isomerase/epimerase